jgi:hypothetical protein
VVFFNFILKTMNQLTEACDLIFDQLTEAIEQLSETEFSKPSTILSGSSVGQHLRHTLEFFVCLEKGYERGVINYDKRNHDKLIETNKSIALSAIDRIRFFVHSQENDKPLQLEVGYDALEKDKGVISVNTNYFRELTYNIEHAVHHMAIMKIGIREVAQHVSVPVGFGVAASTLRYRGGILERAF